LRTWLSARTGLKKPCASICKRSRISHQARIIELHGSSTLDIDLGKLFGFTVAMHKEIDDQLHQGSRRISCPLEISEMMIATTDPMYWLHEIQEHIPPEFIRAQKILDHKREIFR
jgi:hypothetical protein